MSTTQAIKINITMDENTRDVLIHTIDRATNVGAELEFEIMLYDNLIYFPREDDSPGLAGPEPLQPESKNAVLTVKLK